MTARSATPCRLAQIGRSGHENQTGNPASLQGRHDCRHGGECGEQRTQQPSSLSESRWTPSNPDKNAQSGDPDENEGQHRT